MLTTSVGLFDSFSQAMRAVAVLQGCGLSRDEISVVIRKNEMKETDRNAVNTYNAADKRRIILSELITFIADADSLFIGGIGQVVMTGPLACILTDTTGEVQSGDLADALMVLEVPDEEAKRYAEGVRRGGTLLAVTAANSLADRAEDVLLLHGAVDLRQRTIRWRQQGWSNFSSTSEPYSTTDPERERRWYASECKPGRNWTPYDKDFRSHYYLTYSDGDLSYDDYVSAYCYGYQLAGDARYGTKDWDEVETQIQRSWEKEDDRAWETVVDAVSYGFLKRREADAHYTRH
jgi:hypothetical protein